MLYWLIHGIDAHHKRKPPSSKNISNNTLILTLKLLIDLDIYAIYNSAYHFV